MPKQILLLVAVTLGIGAEAVTHPAGSVRIVDDEVADELLQSEPPAAALDNSKLPEPPKKQRRAAAAPAPGPAPDTAGGSDAGSDAGGESAVGEPAGPAGADDPGQG
jgi:hypothetical protein